MKKFIALLFFMLVISSVAFSATTKDDKKVQGTAPTGKDADLMTEEEKQEFKLSFGYEPYATSEFPSWTHKLRRAEVITFGATALTFPLLNIIFQNTGTKFSNNDTLDFLAKFGIAAGAGLIIAIIDLSIGEVITEEEE